MPDVHEGPARGTRRTLAIAAIVAGLGLLAGAGLLWARHAQRPAAYAYVLGDPVAAADLGPWAPLAKHGIEVRKASVVGADGTRLADLEVAETARGPVLLDWRPTVDPPFLTSPPPADDVAALAPVLGRHVAQQEPVLAWWDTSRELALLADADYLFRDALGIPLFLSPGWDAQRTRIAAIESRFWGDPGDDATRARFQRFVHALLADPTEGVAELRKLAGDRKAVLVVHARDILLLGQLAPDKIGVAIRDFANTGNVHGMAPAVKDWLRANHYEAYTVVRLDGGKQVRAIALTDQASGRTLAARLLPFVGNDQSSVPGTVLVYKAGGFWVYELGPDTDARRAGDAGERNAP